MTTQLLIQEYFVDKLLTLLLMVHCKLGKASVVNPIAFSYCEAVHSDYHMLNVCLKKRMCKSIFSLVMHTESQACRFMPEILCISS